MPAHLYDTPDEPPTFDVEEYRGDLQRRLEALGKLAEDAHRHGSRENWLRAEHKAQGIQIALDLLPRKVD